VLIDVTLGCLRSLGQSAGTHVVAHALGMSGLPP
jgi:hypothetical protein